MQHAHTIYYRWYPYGENAAASALSLEARGFLAYLSDAIALNGSVPDDVGALARIVRVDRRVARRLLIEVRPMLSAEDGRLSMPLKTNRRETDAA